jgi:hypothetical protein
MTDKPLTAEEIDKWLAYYSEQPIGMLDGTATRICAAARASVDSELTDDAYQPGGPMSRLRAQVEYLTSDGDEQIVELRKEVERLTDENDALVKENERVLASPQLAQAYIDNRTLRAEVERQRQTIMELSYQVKNSDAEDAITISTFRAENERMRARDWDLDNDVLLRENDRLRAEVADAIRDERERCAKIAEARAQPDQMLERYPDDYAMGVINTSNAIAAAIRSTE